MTAMAEVLTQGFARMGRADTTIPEWLPNLCERTHGDWRFFAVQRIEAFGETDILVWSNGTRRTYIHLDSIAKEVRREKGLDGAWKHITFYMDRVDGNYGRSA